MITKQISTKQYVLEEKDVKTIVDALTYARHRILKHPTCGAKVMSLSEIQNLINQFHEE